MSKPSFRDRFLNLILVDAEPDANAFEPGEGLTEAQYAEGAKMLAAERQPMTAPEASAQISASAAASQAARTTQAEVTANTPIETDPEVIAAFVNEEVRVAMIPAGTIWWKLKGKFNERYSDPKSQVMVAEIMGGSLEATTPYNPGHVLWDLGEGRTACGDIRLQVIASRDEAIGRAVDGLESSAVAKRAEADQLEARIAELRRTADQEVAQAADLRRQINEGVEAAIEGIDALLAVIDADATFIGIHFPKAKPSEPPGNIRSE